MTICIFFAFVFFRAPRQTTSAIAETKKGEPFNTYVTNIENEISQSKSLIKNKLGKTCRYLAYPYGSTNNIVIEMLKKHGYLGAFTVNRKSNPFFVDPYLIHRSLIFGDYTMDQFKKNLTVFKKMDLK